MVPFCIRCCFTACYKGCLGFRRWAGVPIRNSDLQKTEQLARQDYKISGPLAWRMLSYDLFKQFTEKKLLQIISHTKRIGVEAIVIGENNDGFRPIKVCHDHTGGT